MQADEGEMLTLSTKHPLKSHKHLSLFLTFHDSLIKVPSSEIKTFKKRNLDACKGVSPRQIQISMNDEWRVVLKTKRDLFEWLVLFQPEL